MTRIKKEEHYAYRIISPSLIIILGVVIIPILTTLIYSIFNMDALSSQQGQFVGLKNYAKTLASKDFWQDFNRTLYYTAYSTFLETVLGLMIALLLNRNFAGVKFLRAIIIIPWALPTVVNGSLWKLIFNGEYGVLNALLLKFHILEQYKSFLGDPNMAMNAIVIADTWKMTPLAVIFFLAALQGFDKTVYEAAAVDGAGPVKIFATITLPELKPTILIIIVMRTVEKFKAFDIFYLMTRGGPNNGTRTLMYDTYLKAFTNLNYSEAATFAYLIAMIVGLMTWLYLIILRRGDD